MYWEFRAKCIRIVIVFLCFTAMVVCLKNSDYKKTAVFKGSTFKKVECPLDELFDYLNEKGAEAEYVYAQILIRIDDYRYNWDIEVTTEWKGTASISWHTFSSVGEFQEYAAQESAAPKKKDAGALEFTYYQYQLEEDDHVIDLYHFLGECYNEGDDKISASYLRNSPGKFHADSYCFWQFNRREVVVKDHVLYGLEYRGNIEAVNRDFIYGVFLNYQVQGHKVGPQMMRRVMDEEELYWADHDERTITLENPARTFVEIRGINTYDPYEEGSGSFALMRSADYRLRLYENGPMLRLQFEYWGEPPQKVGLQNGLCTARYYQMNVTNLDTNELLQSQQVKMSIEMPDMIRFIDLDQDGYLDMQIEMPVHLNGVRAVVEEYSGPDFMLWNPEDNLFEPAFASEIEWRLMQNMEEPQDQEDTDFIEYVVQSGDTLWGVSRQFYGTGVRYAEIEEDNAGVLSGHEYLMPGMVLKIRK